jgi:hypothetical protein
MPYDPDGDPRVDPNDVEAIDAWLNNPTVQALHEDLGRQFRALPPEEQIEELATQLMQAQKYRDDLVALLDGAPTSDPRRSLLDALNTQVEGLRRRIAQVRDHRRDG